MAGRRRNSFVQIATNPLEDGAAAAAASVGPKVESLGDSLPILADEFGGLVETLQSLPDNEARLQHLEDAKKPYLFTSEQLLLLMEVTPSIKTKISIVGHVGPRLLDPKSKNDTILDVFTYAEQKKEVELILKARAQNLLASSTPGQPSGGGVMMMGGRGGRGRVPMGSPVMGRGRGRGGPARGTAPSAAPALVQPEPATGPVVEEPLPPPPPVAAAIVAPVPAPVAAATLPPRRPSSTKVALEAEGFESNVIATGSSKSKDRASPITMTDRASPSVGSRGSGDFDVDLKQKTEERQRVTVERRSSKIDDWMQNMKVKGSNEDPEGDTKASSPDSELGDEVFFDREVKTKRTKRLSSVPLTLDRSESNGFPSFEEKKSFEVLAARRPSVTMSPKRSKKVISYDNLLEIVAKKEYGSLIKSELEEYLSDAEFKHCFEMDREVFRGLPNWRKQAMKKTLNLF